VTDAARICVLALGLAACGSDAAGPDAAIDSGRDGPFTTRDDAALGDGGGNVAVFSDEFDGTGLDPSWQVFRPELVDLTVGAGALSITPNQRVLWFDESQGALVHKRITGDFTVTATVRARSAAAPAQPPSMPIHLGGLMVRSAVPVGQGNLEDYVFIVAGYDVNDLSVETKTTVDGSSTYEGPSWPSGDAELRICRLGATFRLYKRAIGAGTWTLARTYTRNDLSGAVQVGPNAYANSDSPDLVVSFDQVVFSDASAGCTE
jgi:hypothetical protein